MILTIVRGLPGSGKSTFAKSLNVLHVEADMYCMKDGQYIFDANKTKHNHFMCRDLVESILRQGVDVVVSNTFTQLWEIEPYLHLAKLFGATVKVIRLETEFGSIHNVPDNVINAMRERFEDFEEETILR